MGSSEYYDGARQFKMVSERLFFIGLKKRKQLSKKYPKKTQTNANKFKKNTKKMQKNGIYGLYICEYTVHHLIVQRNIIFLIAY